ncbi:hypothetical protein PMI31_04018 [Pseudomonas sp. GM55]|nr:hypothetical protein PMI31_04018 [Pseudomonas sp. GM55]
MKYPLLGLLRVVTVRKRQNGEVATSDEAAMFRLFYQLPAGIGRLMPSFFRMSRTYWNFWYCDSSIGPS